MNERLKIARHEAWLSFWHKLGIVAVALLAYGGLVWLGQAKHDYAEDVKKNWPLNQQKLIDLAGAAETVAPQSTDATKSDSALLADIAKNFKGREVETIDSKQEFVAAVEQIADARIYHDSITTIGGFSMERVDLLDRIAGEESLARTRIAATHSVIEAAATRLEADAKAKTLPLQRMFDEKHPLYVLYEICWYMLLALAVLATSWLLLTIFTVLPFTDAEGYWTKRIGDLMGKFAPGLGSAAMPIAAAALVAATVFTGTGLATTPGGLSRSTTHTSTTTRIETKIIDHEPLPPSLTPDDLQNALKVLQSAISTRIAGAEKNVTGSVGYNARVLNQHLNRADETQNSTLQTAERAEENADQANAHAELAARDSGVAAGNTHKVPTIDERTDRLERTVGSVTPPQTPLVTHVGDIDNNLQQSGSKIAEAKADLDAEAAQQSIVRDATLTQATLVDPRNALRRAFGRTLFQVGPVAVLQLAARLGVQVDKDGTPVLPKKPTDDQKTAVALITLLGEKKLGTPMNSGDFRAFLAKGAGADVTALLTRYDRELLHLCALDRD
jgi:hypothetical protein